MLGLEESSSRIDKTRSPQASVWFQAVARGDNEPIVIGAGSNVQEGAVLHADPGFPAVISDDVSVGHGAVLHGCSVGSGTIVGMGAVVMNGASVRFLPWTRIDRPLRKPCWNS